MTDSHCHLDYCENPEEAADSSLTAIVSIGTTLMRCKRTLALAETFGNVWAAVGVHPNDAGEAADPLVREQIAAMAGHPKVVAIGETGVDTYWDKTSLDAQRESFWWQVGLAETHDKPLILHVRDKQGREEASLEAARLILEAGHPKGILHCFNGHETLLRAGLELGWLISFAGNLTYKSAVGAARGGQTDSPEPASRRDRQPLSHTHAKTRQTQRARQRAPHRAVSGRFAR